MGLYNGYFAPRAMDPFGLVLTPLKHVEYALNIMDANLIGADSIIWSATANFSYQCDDKEPMVTSFSSEVSYYETDEKGSDGTITTSVINSDPKKIKITWFGAYANEGSSGASSAVGYVGLVATTGTAVVSISATVVTSGFTAGALAAPTAVVVGATVTAGVTTVSAVFYGVTAIGESVIDDVWSFKLTKKEWIVSCKCINEVWYSIIDRKRVDVDFTSNNDDYTYAEVGR